MTGAKRVTETGDLNSGNGEPIHIPVSIQPHGVLLAMAARTGCISQISANTGPLFGMEAAEILGRRLDQLFAGEDAQNLAHGLENPLLDENPRHLVTVTAPGSGEALSATAHRSNGVSIVEFEPSADPRVAPFPYYPVVSAVTSRLKKAGSVEAIAQVAVEEVRRIAGFDRILVYKFDEDWNGSILAEAAGESMPSFRHLRFVASDIPQHTRKLYEMNRLHFIADASYEAVPLVPPIDPVTNKPLDLSFATLRSAPPGHLGYLRDMGVASSICVSLLADNGRVWGLLACHHPAPRRVPIHVRTACDVLAQIVANQIEMAEQRETYEQRLRLTSLAARLLRFAAEEEYFIDGLTKHPDETLEFANAGGAAILHEGRMTLLGACPKVEDVWRLADWLIEQGREEIYHTDCLPHEIPDGEQFCERASGLLAISISKLYRSYILWFRPEMVQTVSWAGNPQEAENQPSDTRPNMPKSFETWNHTVHGRSLPWTEAELQAAGELRNAVIGIVLRKAEELGALSAELQRSNRELEAFSYSVSHDLRAPFRHIIGYSELLKESPLLQADPTNARYLNIIIQSARFAGTLVDNLLSFSQVGRTKLRPVRLHMGQLVREVLNDLQQEMKGREIELQVGALGEVQGDPMMLRLVWQNLLQNAIKYTRKRENAKIEIQCERKENESVFFVRDNGVGFEQAYADKLFGVFQRLHRMEDFEGTGIGLANVRRIIARHGGRTWAEGEVDRGATFYFSLPETVRGE